MGGVQQPVPGASRRTVLRTGATVAALGAGGGLVRPARAAGSAAPEGPVAGGAVAGEQPARMAMHVHASFSEGTGSMEAHLQQAVAAGFDVLWWTEHDQRMVAHGYRRAVHFHGPTERENGYAWTWSVARSGSFASDVSSWVDSPVSPHDTGAPGALRLRAVSRGAAAAVLRQDGAAAHQLIRTSLAGQRIRIDVLPVARSRKAWVGVEVVTSYRPARDGRPAGVYRVSYRIGGPGTPGTKVRSGTSAVVTLAAPRGAWARLELDPARDLGDTFGIDGRDASTYGLSVAVSSSGSVPAEAVFDNLRFVRTLNDGQEPLAVQRALMAGYATEFPSVVQHQGIEMSHTATHVNWFGGRPTLPDLDGWPVSAPQDWAETERVVDAIHATGGIASYNHPFGTTSRTLSETQQESLRRSVARTLLDRRALTADLLEVGYPRRGGVTLDRHASAWDSCSANCLFLTGTGVSDDHSGQDWLGQQSNFATSAWTPSGARDQASLLRALRGGRAFFHDAARFRGTLDLLVDGAAPMGSVTVARAASRTVRVLGSGLPAGSRVHVVDGLVSYAGSASPDPRLRPRSFAASGDVAVDLAVNTETERFVRVEVRDPSGRQIAFSNPVWLLRDQPPGGIPAARSV